MGGVPDVDSRLPPLENRLERLAALYQAANQQRNPDWRAEFLPGASDADLDHVEQQLGRLLPEEARHLYGWHNGAITAIAAHLRFSSLKVAQGVAASIARFTLPALSNGSSTIDARALFPVFNIERVLFNVLTVDQPGPREKRSGIYVLDFERNQLTMIAYTIQDLIDRLIEELEAGNSMWTQKGMMWRHDPYRFNPSMKPYGRSLKAEGRGLSHGSGFTLRASLRPVCAGRQ